MVGFLKSDHKLFEADLSQGFNPYENVMNFGRESAQNDFYMNLNVEDADNAKTVFKSTNVI